MIAPLVSLRGRDFIDVADLAPSDLRRVLDLASEIKAGRWKDRPLEGRHMAMLFQRPSHRTRVSFEVGIARLGGTTTTLSSQDVQLGFRESVADAARVLDRYVDGAVATPCRPPAAGAVFREACHQRPDGPLASVPGPGRPDDAGGAPRRSLPP